MHIAGYTRTSFQVKLPNYLLTKTANYIMDVNIFNFSYGLLLSSLQTAFGNGFS